MKLTIIKKAIKTAKPQGWCPFYVDDGGFTNPTK
jgi:hypothetical protein